MADSPPQADLVEPGELAALLGQPNLVLIDTRDREVYARSHLPGAVNIQDIFYYLCLPENGGLPAMREHFSRLFGQAGIRPSDRVIVYEDALDNGYGKSCRGWLFLKYLGHTNVGVLHGGMRAWNIARLPLTSDFVEPQSVDFTPRVTPGQIIGCEDMQTALQTPNTVVIDCRDYAEWLGANSSPYGYDYCPRKGRIPGSVWLEWYRLLNHHGGAAWFRSPVEIRELCAQSGIYPEQKVVVYCFKGARASALVMALRLAGFSDVVNYLPSWNEWSRNFALPVDEQYPDIS
jgi:thiosulfate/3-mercaptopyruvate sulfurtransferase